MEEERILKRIPLEIAALSIIIALFSLLFFSPLTALFIIAGGAFSALSFIWLKQTITRLIPMKNGSSQSALLSALLFYGLRLVLILAIFFIIIFFFSKKIIAFIVGFSTVVPVFMVEAASMLLRMKKWKS